METPTTTRDRATVAGDLDRLGAAVADHGAHTLDHDLDAVVARARLMGLRAPSVEVLGDRHAPDVVRARALAHVTRHLVRATPTGGLATVA